MVRGGPYRVADAVADYLDAVRAEKGPTAERRARYIFNASIVPELGEILVEKLTADRLLRWRNSLALRPKRVRTKMTAERPATREVPNDDDARRKRKATANRIVTMLKACLNRAFHAGRVNSDQAWRRVKPFAKVDEAVVRYLTADEMRRLVDACTGQFRALVQAALLTGCRYAELTRLRVSAFNPDSGTLAIRLSKGKVRHVTQATLATVLAGLERNKRLSANRRRGLRYGVTGVARLLGNEPGAIILDLGAIGAKLADINPVAAGITAKTLANIRSEFLAAVLESGVLPVKARPARP
jgi:integrase